MKVAFVLVILAVATGMDASIIPLGHLTPELTYTAVSGSLISAGPTVVQSAIAPGIATIRGPPIVAAAPALIAHSVPLLGHPAPVIAAAPAPVVVAAEGSYIAQTKGAVHVAPLSGHVNSVASINLQPAPGAI